MFIGIEYNWTAMCWQFRVGDTFTDWRGVRSLPTLRDWRDMVRPCRTRLRRVSKTLYRFEVQRPVMNQTEAD